eukprot:s2340_g17.t2
MRAACLKMGRGGVLLALPQLPFLRAAKGRWLSTQDLESLSVAELRQLAAQRSVSTSDCFEKQDLVQKLRASDGGVNNAADGDARGQCAPQSTLASKSVSELRNIIHKAGLSSEDLLEKRDLVERAREAEVLLKQQASKEPKGDDSQTNSEQTKPWDARRYEELEIVLFARGGCPHCVSAVQMLNKRGLRNFDLQDVEWSREAMLEFQRLGGRGVPFFYSKKTGKSMAGWNPGAQDLGWLIHHLE